MQVLLLATKISEPLERKAEAKNKKKRRREEDERKQNTFERNGRNVNIVVS